MASAVPFGWPDKVVEYLVSSFGAEFLMLSALCAGTGTYSSFFSGLGTAELAWRMIAAALLAHGLSFHLIPGFTCECSTQCQDVLMRSASGFLISDIMELMALSSFDPAWDFDAQCRAIRFAAVRTSAWCLRNLCYVALLPPLCTSSGVPCQDHSSAGHRRGLHGKRLHLLLAWMRWHLVMRTPIVILENVPQFTLDFVQEVMGQYYTIVAILCGPEHVGFEMAHRPRLYVALLLKGAVIVLRDLAQTMMAVSRHLRNGVLVRSMLLAEPADIARETMQLRRMRGSQAPVGLRTRGVVHQESLLTQGEGERLLVYTQMWWQRFGVDPTLQPDLVYNLSDNPADGWISWSAPTERRNSFALPVLRRGRKICWIPHERRLLTIREKLAFMGFPSYWHLAEACRADNVFDLTWEEEGLLGNAMHVANIGVWQAVVLACVRIAESR